MAVVLIAFTKTLTPSIERISTLLSFGIISLLSVFADQISPPIFIWPYPFIESISSVTIASFPIIEKAFVFLESFSEEYLLIKGLVKNISNVELIRKTADWIIILSVIKLVIKAKRAPTANQKTKNPTVTASIAKQIPETINQNFHVLLISFIQH